MLTIEQVAAVAHEANRQYCLALGNDSQPPWEQAPAWQKQSAVTGVLFRLANPDASSAYQHQKWFEHKMNDGWVFGPVKDEKLKTHPCLVPYDDLPEDQKAKDALFIGIVKALAPVTEKVKSVGSAG